MKKLLFLLMCIMFSWIICPAQNVGIGTSTPVEKLHVVGNLKVDTVKPDAVQLLSNAGEGKVLTSDVLGNASWKAMNAAASGNIGFGVWGDCATNGNLSEYQPLSDTSVVNNIDFGRSVSISGNYAIVGVPFDIVNGQADRGSANVYQNNGGSWVLMQKLIDATGDINDEFGHSVSISGNFAIIGAVGDDIGAGSVSIFQYNGSSWVLMQKFSDPGGASNDYFGNSVSISGNFAIAGAPGDNIGANLDQGSVNIYQYNGSSWAFLQKLTDALGAGSDQFGYSVHISGNYAIVGVPFDNEAFIDQGSANFYQFNGTSWLFMQKILGLVGAASDNFGISVSVSGNYAAVGAYNDNVGTNADQGSVNIFRYNGTSWVLMQFITDSGGAATDNFGNSVSISGDYIIVGSFVDDVGANPNQGACHIYFRVGNVWGKLQYTTDPMGNANDNFGNATAIDGITKRFLIGVPGYGSTTGKVVFGKVN